MEPTHTTPVAGYGPATAWTIGPWPCGLRALRGGLRAAPLVQCQRPRSASILRAGAGAPRRTERDVRPARGPPRVPRRHVHTLISVCTYFRTPHRRAFVHGSDPLEHTPRGRRVHRQAEHSR